MARMLQPQGESPKFPCLCVFKSLAMGIIQLG